MWLRDLVRADPQDRDELTDECIAPYIKDAVTKTDVRNACDVVVEWPLPFVVSVLS